jgi:hypothetical protein
MTGIDVLHETLISCDHLTRLMAREDLLERDFFQNTIY